MSTESNRKKAEKWKKYLSFALLAVIAILYFTGKLDLSFLNTGEPTEEASQAQTDGETEKATEKATEKPTEKPTEKATEAPTKAAKKYYFRSKSLLDQHYEKHGKEMGFRDAKSYEAAASDVLNDPRALHKTEKEDGDFCYFIVETNEFVVLSKDGYIRTYFLPSAGKSYYDRQ